MKPNHLYGMKSDLCDSLHSSEDMFRNKHFHIFQGKNPP